MEGVTPEPLQLRVVAAEVEKQTDPMAGKEVVIYRYSLRIGGESVFEITDRYSALRTKYGQLGKLLPGAKAHFPGRLGHDVQKRGRDLEAFFNILLIDNKYSVSDNGGEVMQRVHKAVGITGQLSQRLLDAALTRAEFERQPQPDSPRVAAVASPPEAGGGEESAESGEADAAALASSESYTSVGRRTFSEAAMSSAVDEASVNEARSIAAQILHAELHSDAGPMLSEDEDGDSAAGGAPDGDDSLVMVEKGDGSGSPRSTTVPAVMTPTGTTTPSLPTQRRGGDRDEAAAAAATATVLTPDFVPGKMAPIVAKQLFRAAAAPAAVVIPAPATQTEVAEEGVPPSPDEAAAAADAAADADSRRANAPAVGQTAVLQAGTKVRHPDYPPRQDAPLVSVPRVDATRVDKAPTTGGKQHVSARTRSGGCCSCGGPPPE